MHYDRLLKKRLYTDVGSLSDGHWLIKAGHIPQELYKRAELAPELDKLPWSREEENDKFAAFSYKIHRTTKQFRYKRYFVVEYRCREPFPDGGFSPRWIRHYFQRQYIEMLDFFFPGFTLFSTGVDKMAFINFNGVKIGAIMPVRGDKS